MSLDAENPALERSTRSVVFQYSNGLVRMIHPGDARPYSGPWHRGFGQGALITSMPPTTLWQFAR